MHKPSFLLFTSVLFFFFNFAANSANNSAVTLDINGAIGPAVADYIERGITAANKENNQFVIIRMDTPGGLDKSMRQIIKAILASPIPIVTYVAPSGARAASAGTFILYASHVASMAPGTNLGAASPVSLGSGSPVPGQLEGDQTTQPAPQKDVLLEKATNDAIAYIRSLAQMRNRNIEFAEQAIISAKTLTASEAKDNNVIELIANDLDDLLAQLNNYTVEFNDTKVTLTTENINITAVQPDWRNKILSLITDPSVAYILLLIGIYGLFFEFVNPGFVAPGVIGAISLLIALYALQMLPISIVGIVLIILGCLFMLAEIFVPSFGILGIGGAASFVIGSFLLFDSTYASFQLAWQIILGVGTTSALFFFVVINLAIRANKKKVVSGQEAIIDHTGITLEDIEESGQAKINGEIWTVVTQTPLKSGVKVRVVAVKGIKLDVEPL